LKCKAVEKQPRATPLPTLGNEVKKGIESCLYILNSEYGILNTVFHSLPSTLHLPYHLCMDNNVIEHIFAILQEKKKLWQDNTLQEVAQDPFMVLAGCLLSLRTQDPVTQAAAKRLFKRVRTPRDILKIPEKELSAIIYPVGFYRQKARRLLQISDILIEKYNGAVPADLDELLKLPGVGRKTANLVLSVAFDTPAICVDTHVHRIVNRWGYVSTHTPLATEMALREKLPHQYWKRINKLLVLFGQNVCLPRRPRCGSCSLFEVCERIGVAECVV